MSPEGIEVLRYAAFTTDPSGGNPAGVVLDASRLEEARMQAIAKEVGYSETAFVTAISGGYGSIDVRYFSPEMEIPFCGHATIATAIAWCERYRPADLRLSTRAGVVPVEVRDDHGQLTGTLTSVTPSVAGIGDDDLAEVLGALDWAPDDLDDALPPRVAFAGAHHPVIAARTRARLDDLDYDFDRLKRLSLERGWATVQLIWRAGPGEFHARNPFPSGGVVEDPATGAGAAALGAYLRELELVDAPAHVTVHQGLAMGRPSLLEVEIPRGLATGIRVTGTAVRLTG